VRLYRTGFELAYIALNPARVLVAPKITGGLSTVSASLIKEINLTYKSFKDTLPGHGVYYAVSRFEAGEAQG